jgi:hypothetical protein
VYPKDPADFVYAFHPARFPKSKAPKGIMECLRQPDRKFSCTMHEGLDAIAAGVYTSPQVLPLSEAVKATLAHP